VQCAFIHKAQAQTREDMTVLSGVLGLETTGTISELSALIKAHLAAHLEVQHNPCFSAFCS
jgi:hypothetical protein